MRKLVGNATSGDSLFIHCKKSNSSIKSYRHSQSAVSGHGSQIEAYEDVYEVDGMDECEYHVTILGEDPHRL